MITGVFLKTPEVALQLGVGVKKVRRYLREGRIKGMRLGRDWLIPREEIARVLDTQYRKRLRKVSVE
jgi:excisionase family DNA binding protein